MKRILIISYTPIKSDARVLRQLGWLKDKYELSVFGYGDQPMDGVRFIPLQMVRWTRKAGILVQLMLGMYDWFHNYKFRIEETKHLLLSEACKCKPDLVIVNDIDPMPAVANVFTRAELLTPILLDLHEFAPLEMEDDYRWRILFARYRQYLCRRYIPAAEAIMTVTDSFHELYRPYMRWGQEMYTVLNCPDHSYQAGIKKTDSNSIRIVHHGGAIPQRKIHIMIDILRLLDERFSLHFYLIGATPRMANYIEYLKNYSKRDINKRIFFHDPVSVSEIVPTLARYDIGFYLMPASSINTRHAMPNKIFDFMHAGLCIVVSSNPDMAAVVRRSGCGITLPHNSVREAARTFNNLKPEEIEHYKMKSIAAASIYNSKTEGAKFSSIVARLMDTKISHIAVNS